MNGIFHGSRRPWRRARTIAPALALVVMAGCNLDLDNPNSPTEEQVSGSIDAVVAAAVGMQALYAQTIDDYVVTSSLITDEWGTQGTALISYVALFTGPASEIDPSYGVVENPWSRSYLTIKTANTVLDGVEEAGLSGGLRAGVSAMAKLFKAMSYGMLIQQYEEVAIEISLTGSTLRPRAEVLDTILALLESARTDLQGVPDAELAGFRARVEPASFSTRHTINAMLARYYLMDGQYDEAITAADRVPANVLSQFAYPAPTRNPIENLAFQLNGGYVAGLQSWADEAEVGDRRVTYWLDTAAAQPAANPGDSLLYELERYSSPNEGFPVYLPDEMKLIKAEAYARTSRFPQARALVNEVRTQTSSPVNEPVAGLMALPDLLLDTEAELLAEIARQRRYELFAQGLRWEDTRRFGTALTTVPVIDFLPIPQQECNANPTRPCAGTAG